MIWHPEGSDGYEDAVIDVLDESGAVALRIPCHRTVVCRASSVLRDQDKQTDSVVEGRKRLVMAGDDRDDVRRVVAEIYRPLSMGWRRDSKRISKKYQRSTYGTFHRTIKAPTLLDAYKRVVDRWGRSRSLREKYDVSLAVIEIDDIMEVYALHRGRHRAGNAVTAQDVSVATWVAQTVMVQGDPTRDEHVGILQDPTMTKCLSKVAGDEAGLAAKFVAGLAQKAG